MNSKLNNSNVHNLNKEYSKNNFKYNKESTDIIKVNNENKKNSIKSPRVITIASGKGGVGKTNLSINIGIAFHQMGKKVLVMDADLGLANVNVILGLVPKYNLYNVLKGQKKIKEVVLNTPYGIKIIAGASGFYQLANINTEKRIEFIKALQSLNTADIIIIDTAAGISESVVSFLLAADDMIIITSPEPTAITDAYGIIKTIASVGGNSKGIKLVINRVEREIQGKKIADRVSNIANKFLNVQIENIGYIFEDAIVTKAVKRQKPFIVLAPKSKASICVEKIAKRLYDIQQREEPKGLRKFIRTLFGGM